MGLAFGLSEKRILGYVLPAAGRTVSRSGADRSAAARGMENWGGGILEDDDDLYRVLSLLKQWKFERPTVVVLDDYQLINYQKMSHLIETVVKGGYHNLHGVLITRNTYCGNSEMLLLKGYLKIIDRQQFIFHEEDIFAWYNQCGITLSKEEVRSLYEATEGWVSALYLYLLRYEKEHTLLFPSDIYELIDSELYSHLTEECKDFLFSVTPFGNFNYKQAEYVWGKENLYDIISRLQSENAFIIYGEHTKRFYVHSIFLKFLENNMNRLPDERKKAYYTRCGGWFLSEGDYYTAISFYYKVKDFKSSMCVLGREVHGEIPQYKWPLYSQILRECPEEELCSNIRPVFLLTIIACLLNDRKTYEGLREFLVSFGDKCLENEQMGQEYEAGMEYLQAFESYNDLEAMGAHLRKILEIPGNEARLFSRGIPCWTLGSPSIFFLFHRKSGEAEQETERIKKYMADHTRLAKGHGSGSDVIMEAEWRFNQGDFKQTEVLTFAAQTMAEQSEQDTILFCVGFLHLKCAFFRGDKEKFFEILEAMEREVDSDHNSGRFLRKQLELSEAFLYAFGGQEKKIPMWIRKESDYKKRLYCFAWPFYQVVFGRYLLMKKEYLRVIGIYQTLVHDPMYNRHVMFLIYAYLFIAEARYQMNWPEESYEALLEAAELAFRDKIYLPFAESYEGIRPVINRLAEEDRYRESVCRIRELAGLFAEGKEKIFGKTDLERQRILSVREKEFARMACGGMTYSEIADRLFLAKGTVKRSMVVILKKLGIHSRKELSEHKDQFME